MEEEDDILSTLPEDILLQIISLLNSKDAFRTSSISKTWRGFWKAVPHLYFDCAYFTQLSSFDRFVKRFMTLRKDSTTINTVTFKRKGVTRPKLFEKFMNFVVSRNVRHFKMFLGSGGYNFPNSIYSAKSLRSFELKSGGAFFCEPIRPLRLYNLTSLHLECVSFAVQDVFSGCPNLKELSLINCKSRMDVLSVYAPKLVQLVIEITQWGFQSAVSLLTPMLTYFHFKGRWPIRLQTEQLVHLQNLRVEVRSYADWVDGWMNQEKEAIEAKTVMDLLQILRTARFVTLSMDTIERLSVITTLNSQNNPVFEDMKCLRILTTKPEIQKDSIPGPVMKHLFGRCPNAELVVEFIES
jgi:hypothetical protein